MKKHKSIDNMMHAMLTTDSFYQIALAHFGKKMYSCNIIHRTNPPYDELPSWKQLILRKLGIWFGLPPIIDAFIILNCDRSKIDDRKIQDFHDAIEFVRPVGLGLEIHILGRNESTSNMQ